MSVGVRRALFELVDDHCECDTRPCDKDDVCCLPLLVKGARWPEPNNTDDLEETGPWWACGSHRD